MAHNPPQTLSVKRKRHESIPHSLVIQEQEEHSIKRQKSGNFVWRLVQKPGSQVPIPPPSPISQPQQHFRPHKTGSRVLIPRPHHHASTSANEATETKAELTTRTESPPPPLSEAETDTSRPRKRPGASTALRGTKAVVAEKLAKTAEPSEEAVRQFEKFSAEVEQDEQKKAKSTVSDKFKPKVPTRRFKERHPEKAAALAAQDGDAMDIDDYVYETYVREEVMLDSEGNMPIPDGTVGIIVLNQEDEELWNEEESDREFETDDEDENAEEYYANDYPEDELSSDDEFDRNLYKRNYRHGSDDEQYDLNESSSDDGARSDGDEDDEHFRRVGLPKGPGYWAG